MPTKRITTHFTDSPKRDCGLSRLGARSNQESSISPGRWTKERAPGKSYEANVEATASVGGHSVIMRWQAKKESPVWHVVIWKRSTEGNLDRAKKEATTARRYQNAAWLARKAKLEAEYTLPVQRQQDELAVS